MAGKVILVTGSNQGIGFGIIQALSKQRPENTYILGVRSIENGHNAVSQLKELGITSKLEVIQLDITDDTQIAAAVSEVGAKLGRVDVLVNNAAVALIPKPDHSDVRQAFDNVLSVNVSSVAAMTYAFLPLLKKSEDPRVINMSSARGSITRLTAGMMPPTTSIPYCVSKAALNILTMEFAEAEKDVLFQLVSPGFVKTAFNGFRGPKDPVDAAGVVVELVLSKRSKYKSAHWENEGEGMIEVPW